MGQVVRIILGFDNTEKPEKQIKYLKDISKAKKDNIDDENLLRFIETLKEKHDIDEISVFRKGIVIFSSENEGLDNSNKIHDLFDKSKHMMDKKLMMIKDKNWICTFEKEGFVFVVKKAVKLNEVEINAITYDTLKRLDKILLEERNIMNDVYSLA